MAPRVSARSAVATSRPVIVRAASNAIGRGLVTVAAVRWDRAPATVAATPAIAVATVHAARLGIDHSDRGKEEAFAIAVSPGGAVDGREDGSLAGVDRD